MKLLTLLALALNLTALIGGVVLAQKPDPLAQVYHLNLDASAAWKDIDTAEAKLREQFNALEINRAALLTGAGVPKTFWLQCVAESSGVTCYPPKPTPEKK